MIEKPVQGISKDDIDALVADEVREGRTLDYKEKLPGNADKDKKEFLADVSSFANAGGGDMIFGVVEKRDGCPERCGSRSRHQAAHPRRPAAHPRRPDPRGR